MHKALLGLGRICTARVIYGPNTLGEPLEFVPGAHPHGTPRRPDTKRYLVWFDLESRASLAIKTPVDAFLTQTGTYSVRIVVLFMAYISVVMS